MDGLSRPFKSKYSGKCSACGNAIEVGHIIRINDSTGTKVVYHDDCETPSGHGLRTPYVNIGSSKPSSYRRKIRRK